MSVYKLCQPFQQLHCALLFLMTSLLFITFFLFINFYQLNMDFHIPRFVYLRNQLLAQKTKSCAGVVPTGSAVCCAFVKCGS